jgi:hypothetical protein
MHRIDHSLHIPFLVSISPSLKLSFKLSFHLFYLLPLYSSHFLILDSNLLGLSVIHRSPAHEHFFSFYLAGLFCSTSYPCIAIRSLELALVIFAPLWIQICITSF